MGSGSVLKLLLAPSHKIDISVDLMALMALIAEKFDVNLMDCIINRIGNHRLEAAVIEVAARNPSSGNQMMEFLLTQSNIEITGSASIVLFENFDPDIVRDFLKRCSKPPVIDIGTCSQGFLDKFDPEITELVLGTMPTLQMDDDTINFLADNMRILKFLLKTPKANFTANLL
ncbi:hypothetical protein K440DRAFT_644377 [Wilcoxina mikolae CBS 423.85]|nr:hypothetical protein K440DRAFT_644377 [Wilcoxina mikolae CBS 423.85]